MPPPPRHRPHKQQTTGTELATVEVPSHPNRTTTIVSPRAGAVDVWHGREPDLSAPARAATLTSSPGPPAAITIVTRRMRVTQHRQPPARTVRRPRPRDAQVLISWGL